MANKTLAIKSSHKDFAHILYPLYYNVVVIESKACNGHLYAVIVKAYRRITVVYDNFNAWEYPANATDYSLSVIQIAESAAGELFVYVYQPSGAVADLRATCINMTLSEEQIRSLCCTLPSRHIYQLP